MQQRQVSPHTIAAYRDTFRLLLSYVADQTGKKPHRLVLADLDAPLIGGFLQHLDSDRHNSPRTRNARLAAIHSLFNYASLRHPEHAATIQRVLAIPPHRFERNLVTFLTEPEADALLASCDLTSRTGRRDHTMLLLAIQTGLRVSELSSLTIADISLGRGPHVHTIGKGRKERCTPLLPLTVSILTFWLTERAGAPGEPLFATSTSRALSRDAIEHRIALYLTQARTRCPSLQTKKITAHTLRHTAAMRLLVAG